MAKLKNRWDKAIECLLECETVTQASKKSNVPRRTLENWLRCDEFQSRYRAARNQVFNRAIDRLCALANKAVTVLGEALDGQNITRIQLWSAKAIIENSKATNAKLDEPEIYGVLKVAAKMDSETWLQESQTVHEKQKNLPPIE